MPREVSLATRASSAALRRCHDDNLAPAERRDQKLAVQMRIEPSGQTAEVSLAPGADAAVSACVRQVIEAWRFDAAPSAAAVSFDLHFHQRP